MVAPAFRGAVLRIEARVSGSPAVDDYNRPTDAWTLLRTVFVQMQSKRTPVERPVDNVEQTMIPWQAVGEYFDLIDVSPGTHRAVFDPLGTYDTPSRLIYLDIEAMVPDLNSNASATLFLVQKTEAGASR